MFWIPKKSRPAAADAPAGGAPRTLADLRQGEEASVVRLADGCSGPVRRRLLDLGLTLGARVSSEIRSPAGDPVGYRVRGAVVALRREQAEQIIVEPVEPAGAGTAEAGREVSP